VTITPIDVLGSAVHLGRTGGVHAGKGTTAPDHDGWQVRVFHAKTDADVHADTWAVHPESEEAVSCLIGKFRLYLRPEEPGRSEEEVRLTAGTAAIVPRGRWHRIELDTPSTIMAVTAPRGSRREKRAGAR
jgi:mannose-6-phosphate isomerase-like protein (cupin superfamily)